MLSQPTKVKAKPPPLRLDSNVEAENNDRFSSSPMGHAMADYEENEAQSEFYHQFESTLTQLLHEDDLMPFNLHTAASLGITSSVRHLIERCQVDPDSRNSGSWTAIMYASLFSHNETVLYLLEMKANVNLRNPNGKTPLMLAALCGSEETIKLLLMHGALLEERDQDQFTALMLAIQATHGESAQLLLEYGANPNVREEIHGQTPLYIASQSGQYNIARALIQKGVDVNMRTSSGDTAYHVALRNGYAPIANLISEQQQREQLEQHQQQCNPFNVIPLDSTKKTKPNHLLLAPVPTRFKPKSPYTAFFERFAEFPEMSVPGSLPIPDVVIDDVDGVVPETQWFPSPGDVTRYSPEGVESVRDTFNPFNAWPGTSMIFKQAIAPNGNNTNCRPNHFKKSIAKPVIGNISKALPNPWSPACEQRQPAMGSNDTSNYEENSSVKLPRDLSSVLANLGLAKYQMHFEEQDIDLQVFLTMNEQDLREIGVNSLGARRKFLSTIEYFQTRSNYYQIGEEFLVNTYVVKQDLIELKTIWEEMNRIVEVLHNLQGANRSPRATRKRNAYIDQLVKQMQCAERFFKKY